MRPGFGGWRSFWLGPRPEKKTRPPSLRRRETAVCRGRGASSRVGPRGGVSLGWGLFGGGVSSGLGRCLGRQRRGRPPPPSAVLGFVRLFVAVCRPCLLCFGCLAACCSVGRRLLRRLEAAGGYMWLGFRTCGFGFLAFRWAGAVPALLLSHSSHISLTFLSDPPQI